MDRASRFLSSRSASATIAGIATGVAIAVAFSAVELIPLSHTALTVGTNILGAAAAATGLAAVIFALRDFKYRRDRASKWAGDTAHFQAYLETYISDILKSSSNDALEKYLSKVGSYGGNKNNPYITLTPADLEKMIHAYLQSQIKSDVVLDLTKDDLQRIAQARKADAGEVKIEETEDEQ